MKEYQYLDDMISQKADTSSTLTRTHIYETFSTKADVYTRTYLDEKLSLLTWKEVTSDSYTITANENYIVNSTNQVTLSMPDTQNLNFGDILSISALGSGGWKIYPPEGQTIQLGNKVIYRNSSTGEIWRERTNAGSHDWSCLDISSDGRYMSAAGVSKLLIIFHNPLDTFVFALSLPASAGWGRKSGCICR
jgi:hypothetical protein